MGFYHLNSLRLIGHLYMIQKAAPKLPKSRMKLILLCAISVIFPLRLCTAQDIPDDQVPKLPILNEAKAHNRKVDDVESKLKSLFSKTTSFEYVTQRNTPKDIFYAKLLWKEFGEQYYYDEFVSNKSTHMEIHEIVSFNGKRNFHFTPSIGQIRVKDGPPTNLFGPQNFPSPLYPFYFLETENKFIVMRDLSPDSPLWDDISSRMAYVGTDKFANRDCIVIRFFNSFSQSMKEKATYDVYFTLDNLLPIGWKSYDDQNVIIEQLEVLEVQSLVGKTDPAPVPCPSRYRITQYQWPGVITTPNGVVKYYKAAREERFDDMMINSVSDSDIVLDPGIANSIFDEDSKVLIKIPK